MQVSIQIAAPVNGHYTGRTKEDIKSAAVPVVLLLVSLQLKKKEKKKDQIRTNKNEPPLVGGH